MTVEDDSFKGGEEDKEDDEVHVTGKLEGELCREEEENRRK